MNMHITNELHFSFFVRTFIEVFTYFLTNMATETTVHAHQSQHFEDLQMSAKEFYGLLKKMIEEYRYPEVKCEPVTLSESGLFSSRREYLRISKGRYHYYVCASPFGKIVQMHAVWNTLNVNLNRFDLTFEIEPSVDALTIIFENEASIDDLQGLEKACDNWSFIVYGFGRLVGENDSKAEVLSIRRGSLLLNLGIVRAIIKAITKCSNEISDSLLKALQVKEKILELRKIATTVSAAELDVWEKRERLKTSALTNQVAKNLLEEYQKDPLKEDFNEIRTAVKKAVKKMILFQADGGKVDPKLISLDGSEKEAVDSIRKLNDQVKKKQDELKNIQQGNERLLLLQDNEEDDDDREDKSQDDQKKLKKEDNKLVSDDDIGQE